MNRVGINIWLRCLAVMTVLLCSASSWAAPDPVPDVRVLIDVSGSMKENDPQNLRRSALELLVRSMPKRARAGIWFFGERVTQMVPIKITDSNWQRRARVAGFKVHSSERFTDIEAALKRVMESWKEKDPRTKRSIILVTDGLVDIAKDPEKSKASRERIIKNLLPQLKDLAISVNSIGLSDQADQELLHHLALGTDGWQEKVKEANMLSRAFLKMFEKSVKRDTVPLLDNKFTIDDQIQDMTLLVFSKPNGKPPKIISPTQEHINQASHPSSVEWVKENGYDLVTVNQPEVGEWQIDADVDPDNRVMVVTNLKLSVDPLPNNVIAGAVMPLFTRLTQQDKPISDADFLRVVKFDASYQHQNGATVNRILNDDGVSPDQTRSDGNYSAWLPESLDEGIYELQIIADGGSFQRVHRHQLRVHPIPITIDFEYREAQPKGYQQLIVTADEQLLQTDSIEIRASFPNGESQPIHVPRQDEKVWGVQMAMQHEGAMMDLAITGLLIDGTPYRTYKLLQVPGGEPSAKTAIPANSEENTDEPTEEEKPTDWMRIALYVILANLALIGIGFAGYLLWKRKKQASGDDLELSLEKGGANADEENATKEEKKK